MADRANTHGRLDASGRREVVYCHACENEWYNDEHGLTCPSCESEATEIVSPENDPRRPNAPEPPPELAGLYEHNPWGDEEDEDLQAISPSPFILSSAAAVLQRAAQRQNAGGPGGPGGPGGAGGPGNANDAIMREFNGVVTGNIAGPSQEFRRDLAARQASQGAPAGRQPPGVRGPRRNWTDAWVANMERIQRVQRDNSVRVRPRDGGGVIYRAAAVPMPLHRNADGQPEALGGAALNDLLQSLFRPPGEHNHDHDGHNHGLPPDFQGLLALLSPLGPGGVHGDAVYTQEAMDRVISQLMETHQTSNAPGPAPPAAIAALPKKKLDNEMLGPEGKGECCVCMDDVTIGDEVVQLPCGHWFHEACASAWLGEHNTCPICRTGLPTDDTSTPLSSSSTADSNRRPSRGSRSGTLHATNPDRGPNSDPDSDHPGGEYPAYQFGGGVDWLGRAFIPGRGHYYPPEAFVQATVDGVRGPLVQATADGVRGPYGLDGRPQVPDDVQMRRAAQAYSEYAAAADAARRRGERAALEARLNRAGVNPLHPDFGAASAADAAYFADAARRRGDRLAAEALVDPDDAARRRGDRAVAEALVDRAAAEALVDPDAARRRFDRAAVEALINDEAFGQDSPNIEASRRALLNEEASRLTRRRSPSLRMPGSFDSTESLQRRDSGMSLDTPAETGPSRTNSESQRSTRSLSGNGQSGQSGNGGGSAVSNWLGRFRSNRRQDNA